MAIRLGDHQRRHSQDYSINQRHTGMQAGEILKEKALMAEQESLVVLTLYNRKRWREALDDGDDDEEEYRRSIFLTGARLLALTSSELNEMWASRVVAGDPDVNKYAINSVEPFMTSSSNSVASTTIWL